MPDVYTDRTFTDTELLDELQRVVGDQNNFIEIARRGCVVDGTIFEGGPSFDVRQVLTYFLNSYRREEAYVEDGKKEGYEYELTLPHSTR